MSNRRVLISRRKWDGSKGFKGEWESLGEAAFHDFAIDYDELQPGVVAMFPVAVVEWPDGTVEAVPIAGNYSVQFISEVTLK